MPRAPTCGEVCAGGLVMGTFAAGVGYGIAWAGFGFEGWALWPHHAGLAGGSLLGGFVGAALVLKRAHAVAVRKFGEGKLGPPDPPR